MEIVAGHMYNIDNQWRSECHMRGGYPYEKELETDGFVAMHVPDLQRCFGAGKQLPDS